MADGRAPIKLDFTSGLEKLPPRPKMDPAATTQASVDAGRELGFTGRIEAYRAPDPIPTPEPAKPKIDGRSLRSRGATAQMNIKLRAEEKDLIVREASALIMDPTSRINSIGEYVMEAVYAYRKSQER